MGNEIAQHAKKTKKVHTLKDKKEFLLIFLCWLVYTTAYVGKYSYVSCMTLIQDFYHETDKAVGLVSSIFCITYGAGQIISALFCKYYPKRIIVACSLVLSAAINCILYFILYFNDPFWIIKYLWFLNAAVQSVLWTTLVQTISTYVCKEKIKASVIAMATTVAAGTVLSYSASALFAKLDAFRVTFLFATIVLIVVAVLWFFGYGYAVKGLKIQNAADGEDCACKDSKDNSGAKVSSDILSEDAKLAKRKLNRVFYATFICLAAFAIVDNFVKDGLNNWTPKVLKDMYSLPDSISIISTIVLPVFGVFGSFLAVSVNKYIKNFVLMCGLFFTISAILIACVIGLFNTPLLVLLLGCFGIISLVMHAINNAITSMFALYMPDNSKAGFYSGILDGACYLGSAIGGVGLGAFADKFHGDWIPIFWLLLGCCALPVMVAAVVFFVKLFNRKKVCTSVTPSVTAADNCETIVNCNNSNINDNCNDCNVNDNCNDCNISNRENVDDLAKDDCENTHEE